MYKKILKLFNLLSSKQKKYLLLNFIISTLSSFMEIVSVGALIYFITYITKKSLESSPVQFENIFESFSTQINYEPIYVLGVFTIIVILISNLFIVLNYFFNSYLSLSLAVVPALK